MFRVGVGATIVLALLAAGCGGSSAPPVSSAPTAKGAGQCLKNAYNSSKGPGPCAADVKLAEQVERRNQGSTTVPLITKVTCVKKVGNEFSCAATLVTGEQVNYDVTYDGTNINYQGH
jgi:hypothetical protein